MKPDPNIARITTWPTVDWKTENAEVNDSDFVFDRVTFDPETMMIYVKASNEVLEDAENMADLIVTSFATQAAYEMDRVALLGSSGSGEPVGIYNFSSLTTGDDLSTAAISDFSPFLTTVENLMSADVTPNAFVMHPKTYIDVEGLTATDNQPLMKLKVLQDMSWYKNKQDSDKPGNRN